MFPCKQVIVFLILQNIISTFCDPLPLHVFSGDSVDISSDELLDYSREHDGAWKNNILIVGQEALSTKSNFYASVEGNINEYSENEANEHDDYIDCYDDCSGNDETEQPPNSSEDNPEDNVYKNPNEFCPLEDYSLISHSDIQYLIEDKAETLNIKDNIFSSYYPDAEKIFKKHMEELAEFQKRFQERPEHLLHVLRSMTSLRRELEPDVEELAAQLDQFEALEDNFNAAAKGSVVMLDQLEKYKKICHINCDETETRFGHDIVSDPSIRVKPNGGMYCIRLKHLNDYINKKLSEVESEYNNTLSKPLDMRDTLYEQKILELESNLKVAAVKQFGMTMYDVLSLHDDYHHFRSHLEHVNVSSEMYNIMENNAEISFKLIGLKRDLEKYRQYCMKCGNARMKRHIPEGGVQVEEKPEGEDSYDAGEDSEEKPEGEDSYDAGEDSEDIYGDKDEDISIPEEDIYGDKDEDISTPEEDVSGDEDEEDISSPAEGTETDILSVEAEVDELIQSKIDEIKESIESNLKTIFAELDEKINDPDVINQYVKNLNPIQKTIEEEIKKEQEALFKLRNRIPETSINKILVLSKESKQMVQNLESAKQFIDNVLI